MSPKNSEAKARIAASHPFLLIHEAARLTPDALGLVVDAKSYSFAETSVAILSMADYLRSRGISRGDLVAVDLPMDFDVIAKHALFLLGAQSCSLFGFLKVPKGLEPDWLITAPGKHPASNNTLILEPGAISLDPNLKLSDFDIGFIRSDRPALLIYTSGTTGSSKAVVMTDSQLAGRVHAYQEVVSQDGLSVGLIYNSGVGLFIQLEQLSRGKPIVFASNRLDAIQAVLFKLEPTGYVASPTQLIMLLNDPEISAHLSEVQEYFVTGSVVSQPQLSRLRSASPNARVVSTFGSNETGLVTFSELDPSVSTYFVGSAVMGAEIEIVDEQGEAVADGEVGTVRTKTDYMASQYHNDIYETAKSFRGGWFYPGDMGYLDEEGGLHLAGRAGDIINAGGVKINPHEVEQRVLSLDGISDCAGVEVLGPSGVSAFGLAVVGEGKIDLVRLENLLKSYFPFGYPTVFQQLSKLPRNQNGKTDKSALKSMMQLSQE